MDKLARRIFAASAVLSLTACGLQPATPAAQSLEQSISRRTPAVDKTEFFANGRNIRFTRNGGAATNFFIKGVDYAPSPICSGSIGNPLGNNESALWQRDLPQLRNLGANAVKVYNVDLNVGPIDRFLTAAYNGGNQPVYVVLSIFFPGAAALNSGAVADLANQYKRLASTYGASPAVLGISIGSEVNADNLVTQPAFWQGMNAIADGARQGLQQAGARKIITTSMVDGYNGDTRSGIRSPTASSTGSRSTPGASTSTAASRLQEPTSGRKPNSTPPNRSCSASGVRPKRTIPMATPTKPWNGRRAKSRR